MSQDTKTGAIALAGEFEDIKGIFEFEIANYEREITGKGISIMAYHPDSRNISIWDYQNEHMTDIVPAGYHVRVVNASVRFTR